MENLKIIESLEKTIILGEELLTTFDVEDLLRRVVKSVKTLLNAEGATLYLIDPLEKLMISQVILSNKVEEIILNIDNTSVAGYTALHRTSLCIKDVYGDLSYIHPDLRFNRSIDEAHHFRTRNIITYPLVLKNEVVGVFQVVNKREGDFCPADQLVLKNFSVISGIAISNARLMEQVNEERSKTLDIVEHISDEVMIIDREGKLAYFNRKTREYLPPGVSVEEAQGRQWTEMFPFIKGLQHEVRKVIDNNLDKAFSGGKIPYLILTMKNNRNVVEKIILIFTSGSLKKLSQNLPDTVSD
ncbi:GAF domain-containing protein [bacterium]|nr:GAF domain-containing protein [bacterium]